MQSRSVMLVDDDPDCVEVHRCILASAGYDVWCFHEVGDALRHLEQHTPGLVIADLMMDSIDSGFALARSIKRDARLARTPVLIVTAMRKELGLDFHPRSEEDLQAIGADGWLDKPARPQTLLAKVRELIGAPGCNTP